MLGDRNIYLEHGVKPPPRITSTARRTNRPNFWVSQPGDLLIEIILRQWFFSPVGRSFYLALLLTHRRRRWGPAKKPDVLAIRMNQAKRMQSTDRTRRTGRGNVDLERRQGRNGKIEGGTCVYSHCKAQAYRRTMSRRLSTCSLLLSSC